MAVYAVIALNYYLWFYRHLVFCVGHMMKRKVQLHFRKLFKHGETPILQNLPNVLPVCIAQFYWCASVEDAYILMADTLTYLI